MYYASKVGLKKIYERVCYYHKQYRKYHCNYKNICGLCSQYQFANPFFFMDN